MIHLEIGGTSYKLDEEKAAFQGAEGRLFRIPKLPKKLVKVYKTEADYPGRDANSVRLRQMAIKRGQVLRQKLDAMPKLPRGVIAPKGVILEGENFVRGIVLKEVANATPLSEFVNPEWRKRQKDLHGLITEVFQRLHKILSRLHELGIVLGDFKPQNILVSKRRPYIIDIESAAFAGFPATGFTWEYADPLWVGSPLAHDAVVNALLPKQQETEYFDDEDEDDWDDDDDEYEDDEKPPPASVQPLPAGMIEIGQPSFLNDWYSFALMLFEARSGISAFSGIYFPKKEAEAVPEADRMFRGISCLHEKVVLPRNGKALEVFSSTEIVYYRRIFQQKLRTVFNLGLVEHREPEVAAAS